MRSYWEQKHFTNYDHIIVGSGVSGLFTAVNIKRTYPHERVLIVEKGWIGCGASSKNAGFACMGSLTELEDDLASTSEKEIISLFENRYHGLRIMREELGDENIGYRENGSYELLSNKEDLDKIEKWNSLLHHIENRNVFSKAQSSDFNFNGFQAIIKNELEGEIDAGKMLRSLISKAQSLGVECMQNTKVDSFEKIVGGFELHTASGLKLSSKRLILCTNAFTPALLPKVNIRPGRGQVIITKPIANLHLKGIYHFDRGYYYFREIDGRVLFGGGRHLDKLGEETCQLGENEMVLSDLKTKLRENILPNTAFEIDYSWSGIMAFHERKKPICKQVEEGLYVLAGFGGMGIALAPFMARELVNDLINNYYL